MSNECVLVGGGWCSPPPLPSLYTCTLLVLSLPLLSSVVTWLEQSAHSESSEHTDGQQFTCKFVLTNYNVDTVN